MDWKAKKKPKHAESSEKWKALPILPTKTENHFWVFLSIQLASTNVGWYKL